MKICSPWSNVLLNIIINMRVKSLEENKTSSPHWTGQQAQRDLQQAAVSQPDGVIEKKPNVANMANRYEANRVRVTGGHVQMQAMVKMETGSPSSNMPTRHGLLEKKRGVVGVVGLEGWRCWFGSDWVEEWGRGVSVSIRHRLTADSCVRRDHGQLTRTRPELASCVCLCTTPTRITHAFRCLIFYPNGSHILLAISAFLTLVASPSFPWHLSSQSIRLCELAWEHNIYPEHTLPVILAEVILFKLTFKPISFSRSVVPRVCATT